MTFHDDDSSHRSMTFRAVAKADERGVASRVCVSVRRRRKGVFGVSAQTCSARMLVNDRPRKCSLCFVLASF